LRSFSKDIATPGETIYNYFYARVVLNIYLQVRSIAMDKITFNVDGMSCGHCKAAVEKALKELSGVQTAEAVLDAKTVTVIYDANKVNRDSLAGAITAAGYEVKD
jgi:copper chaperone